MNPFYTLSLKIFDDLHPFYGSSRNVKSKLTMKSIKKNLHEMLKDFKIGKNYDRSEFFDKEFFDDEENYLNKIAKELFTKKYYVVNRYNKYYVIAFAINYTRFEIFSKDCDKELIDWGSNNNSQIVNLITDPDYNENPVSKLIKSISSNK